MGYKYMRIFHEEGKTKGVKTASKSEASQAGREACPTAFEIIRERTDVRRRWLVIEPVRLKDGYYPLDYFEDKTPDADFAKNGINPVRKNRSVYVGPSEGIWQ